MLKKILGSFLIVITFYIDLYANVEARLNVPAIYEGESVDLIITAEGDSVEFPNIDKIGIYDILRTSSSQSTTIINGDLTRSFTKTYTFAPRKSITVPSYNVIVDGKKYQTKELKIAVLKPTANKHGADFILNMDVDKKSVYVGESIKLVVTFKQKLNAHADRVELSEPKLEDFWIKKVEGIEKSSDADYIVQKLTYILFPQKSGKYIIKPLEANIGKLVQRRSSFFDDPFFDSFTSEFRWQKIFSNEIELDIKPLPNGIELFGDFEIEASVDKYEVKANKPVNLTITIKGEGNIDDIKKFDLDIDQAIVYADEPKITSTLTNGVYGGEFIQKIAIIAENDFEIPPIELTYFDKKTKKIKTIKTKPIYIKVKGGIKKEKKPDLETLHDDNNIKSSNQKVKIANESDHIKYLFLLIGFLLGGVIGYFINRVQKKEVKKELDIIKAIKKAKTDKELFELLLPYAKKDKLITQTLEKLEQNLYNNQKHKIDKNKLIEFFEFEEDN